MNSTTTNTYPREAQGMRNLDIMDSPNKVPFLSGVVRRQGGEDAAIEILEAGCGHRWLLRLEGKRYKLVGVDLDKDALESRKNVKKDLDEAIHGDLRTIDFGSRRFDVVYSAFVLEHIAGAEEVLTRMVSWLKPDGIIVIEIPDPDTVKGRVTKITPHWFHVFYYRYILGKKHAGQVGYGPYRTIYEPVVSRKGIARLLQPPRPAGRARIRLSHRWPSRQTDARAAGHGDQGRQPADPGHVLRQARRPAVRVAPHCVTPECKSVPCSPSAS
jgi:SAM-dependent methyltransferase